MQEEHSLLPPYPPFLHLQHAAPRRGDTPRLHLELGAQEELRSRRRVRLRRSRRHRASHLEAGAGQGGGGTLSPPIGGRGSDGGEGVGDTQAAAPPL